MLKKTISSLLAVSLTAASLVILPAAPAVAQVTPASCDRYARDYANSQKNTANDLVGGAVVGAVGGALIGRLAGKKNVGDGALIGAGVGAVGGAAQGSKKWQKRYNKAYNECMSRAPAPAAVVAPAPGTPAWYDYCRAKYRSFNPKTGLFLSSTGQYKPCQ